MISINVTTNNAALKKTLRELTAKQVPFANMLALNATAEDVRQAEIAAMKQVFKNPTPYTLNSMFARRATKSKQEANVWLKDAAGKGTPAGKYLTPQIMGGSRHFKRFEKALQAAGVLPPGMFAVPGRGAQLDSNGNMDRGQIVQLLSYMRAFGEQGYRANMSDKRRGSLAKGSVKKGIRGFQYFVVKERHGKLPPGIYKKKSYTQAERNRVSHLQGDAATPVIVFIKAPSYSKRLAFFEIAERTIAKKYNANFNSAMAKALAAAK